MENQLFLKTSFKFAAAISTLLILVTWSSPMIPEQLISVFNILNPGPSDNTLRSSFAQEIDSNTSKKTKLVYHLSSDEPWRATIALLDSQTMLKMGYNVTLMLSIEGVQLGVKNPHHYLGLEPLTSNVTDFMHKGGTVIICEVCLKISGYNNSDVIKGSVIGTPSIMANLLNQTTVVDY